MLTFPLGGGTFEFAAVSQGTHDDFIVKVPNPAFPADPDAPATLAITNDQDALIPKLEASYDVKFGGFNLWIGGGYQTYKEVVVATDREYDIDAWGLSIYGSYGFGPVTVNLGLSASQNAFEYGFTGAPPPTLPSVPLSTAFKASYNSLDDGIIDAELFGWHLSAGWKISDMLTLQAGYGANDFTRDANSSLGEIAQAEDTTAFYYINMPIFAAKGLTITPEIGVTDESDVTDPLTGVKTDQGKTTYYGVRWFIRF
jgi:hypothetical protein